MAGPAALTRRDLLRGAPHPARFRPRPPGVTIRSLDVCTRCRRCVDACPEGILDVESDGVVLRPDLGECTFCGVCASSCPEPVFETPANMAHVMEITGDCLVRAGIACMTCRDACPEQAITLRPRIGGPFLPDLDTGACTGCGACVAPCPADAIHAVEREGEDA